VSAGRFIVLRPAALLLAASNAAQPTAATNDLQKGDLIIAIDSALTGDAKPV
jgi:hypothetical protein